MWWLVPSYANKGVGLLLWSAKIELEQRNMVDKERTIFGLDTIYRIFPKAQKLLKVVKMLLEMEWVLSMKYECN